jgi:hypothetical protein
MQIEMVDTTLGPLPRVALTRTERVVEDNDDQRTIQVEWAMPETGEIVRRDGYVTVKRWPEGMNLLPGRAQAGG